MQVIGDIPVNLVQIPFSQVPIGGFCLWTAGDGKTYQIFKADPSALAPGITAIDLKTGTGSDSALAPSTLVAYDPNAGIQL